MSEIEPDPWEVLLVYDFERTSILRAALERGVLEQRSDGLYLAEGNSPAFLNGFLSGWGRAPWNKWGKAARAIKAEHKANGRISLTRD